MHDSDPTDGGPFDADDPFEGEPGGTRERIMRATYRVLRDHGYAGVSLQKIADEADLSKSSVYHFYDDKEDLVVAFLEFMLGRFRGEFEPAAASDRTDPVEGVRTFLTHTVAGEVHPGAAPSDRSERVPFGPYLELRAQAVNSAAFRERFADLDDLFVAELAGLIERGVESGTFREVDPEAAADLLLTLMMGAMVRRATDERLETGRLMGEVDVLLDRYLLAD